MGGATACSVSTRPLVSTWSRRYADCVSTADEYWDTIYTTKDPTDVSWYQQSPRTSLRLIESVARSDDAIIDIGAGVSTLIPSLASSGYTQLSALDVSARALDQLRSNDLAGDVRFFTVDIRRWEPPQQFDVWHDRAVFHFMLETADREAYLATMNAALALGAHVILGAFAEDGPQECSGLPVVRYSISDLTQTLGPRYDVLASEQEQHHTPWGSVQNFNWIVARRAR